MALFVLGPLRLTGPAGFVQVPGAKTREVLTLLALAAPRPLSVPTLVDYADPDGSWVLGDVARVLMDFDVFTRGHRGLA